MCLRIYVSKYLAKYKLENVTRKLPFFRHIFIYSRKLQTFVTFINIYNFYIAVFNLVTTDRFIPEILGARINV